MNFKGFKYNSNNELCCEHVSLKELGDIYKTPLYVYSGNSIVSSYKSLKKSLSNTKTKINFALKANSTLGILSMLSKLGELSGTKYRVVGEEPATVEGYKNKKIAKIMSVKK